MGKITITCRNRQVSIDGLKAIKVRVVSLNGAILESFLRYQVIKNGRGKTWHHENALAMSLLLEYWQATLGVYGSPRLMFEAFSVAIHGGTVQVDGTDPIGLRWKPRSPHHANKLIRYISEYSDWLYVETGEESALLNPIRSATPYEKMLNLAAYHHRKNNSFLKHTYDDSKAREQAGHVRAIAKHQGPKNKQVTYTFPRDKSLEVEDSFIICGSKISDPPQNRLDLAKVLVFMLMRYAGLRISEVPNIYVVDITVDPAKSDMSKDKKIPLVKVHHPDKGFAPDEWRKKYNRPDARRAEYLMTEYSMLPRNNRNSPKSLYTGWKNPVLIPNQNYMIAYFNNTQAAEMFLIYWQLYLKYQAPKNQSHPFAFSNLKDGNPLSYKAIEDGLKRAVERVGLISSKSEGTTPHGLRHLYKDDLKKMNLSRHIIQSVMHHGSIHSQEEYAQPSHEEINAEMDKAENKISAFMETKEKLNRLKGTL